MKEMHLKAMPEWQRELMAKHPAMFEHLWRPPECFAGWNSLLDQLMTDIEAAIDCSGEKIVFEVHQIKEKFGGLRFYAEVEGASDELTKRLERLITEAEAKSYDVCEKCGEPGQLRRGDGRPWIRTLCDGCDEKEKKDVD